jgi:hypothetical protein
MVYYLINRNDKTMTSMAENTLRMEAKQMAVAVALAASKAAAIAKVALVKDKTSSTSICNRPMRYSDSFSEVKILSQIFSMMKMISLVAQDLVKCKWEWASKELKINLLVEEVKIEIHLAWVIPLEAWEAKTFLEVAVSEACR